MTNFDKDKKFTVQNSKFAVAVLQHIYNGAFVFSAEKEHFEKSPPIIKALDKVGIDLLMFHEGTFTGISNRCHRKISKRGYTVTIRETRKDKQAEFFFLQRGLKQPSALVARLNVQSYISSDGKSAVVILMRNSDLIRYIESLKEEEIHKFTDKDGVTFISVRWLDLLNAGIDFQLFSVDSQAVSEIEKKSFLTNKKAAN